MPESVCSSFSTATHGVRDGVAFVTVIALASALLVTSGSAITNGPRVTTKTPSQPYLSPARASKKQSIED